MPNLTDEIGRLLAHVQTADSRVILGIAGRPGAGKSTVAQNVLAAATHAGVPAVIVGMDGWHLAHSTLTRLGLEHVKGAPHTFDADGFVHALRRVRGQRGQDAPIWLPEFQREIEDAIAGAVDVSPQHRLVVVEGNYLLLRTQPWDEVRGLLDVVWFLDGDDAVRRERLIARHEQFGRSHDEAQRHADGSDQANAQLVAAHSDLTNAVVLQTY